MKIQLETINPASKSPFRLLHDPKLNHLFYWHFHPEYELVYIEGASAIRHVGNHISQFEDGDLVLIGSNIPHLNFDHGVKTNYRKEVLHIKTQFKEGFISQTPALDSIDKLLEQSKYGLAFSGETKNEIGALLKELHLLEPFDFFMKSLDILKKLSQSSEYELLHSTPYVNRFRKNEQDRMRQIYALVDERYQGKIGVNEVAALCNLTKPAFCRYFKKSTGNTFISFLNQYRISQAKRLLLLGNNISETCYDSGFESLSYFNRTFKKVTGENPSEFKRRHFSS